MTIESDVIIVPISRWKALLLLFIATAFVAIGVMMTNQGNLFGWVAIAFFGLGVPVSLYMLVPGAMQLRIDRHGFEMKSPFRPTKLSWQDVDGFFVANISNDKMIGIQYSQSYNKQSAGRRLAAGLTGVEGALPSNFTRSAEDVCRLLNESKSRWGMQP